MLQLTSLQGARLTVLGASGFIGSHLSHYLTGIGLEPFTPARDDERLYHEPLGHVIYGIGLTADFRRRPFDTVEAHVCLLSRLIERARFTSLTYLSSTRVYHRSSSTREEARLEVDPTAPDDLYSLSKLMGESLCLQSGHPGMKIVRLSNVVGLRRDADSFIGQLLHEAEECGRITLKGSMMASRDYIDIGDAVSILTRITLSDSGGIFNVASGECIRNQEVARLIADALNIELIPNSNQAIHNSSEIDISRIRHEFNFKPRRFCDYFPELLKNYERKKHLSRNDS